MSKRFRRGLIVGKFCPLHLGHEFAIREMMADCEEGIILSYTNPEFDGCDPAKRRRWLNARFPGARALVLDGCDVPPNDAAEIDHRRFVARLCRARLGGSVEAVFTSEGYGDGFAQELTRCFREAEPAHPPVQHIAVDAARAHFPISGSALRADIHANRRFLSPEVYADFVVRVCLLGGESSGKSTLAKALAERFGTACVPEFGRELWERQGGHLAFADMRVIAETQIAREDAAARQAHRFLFCDTSPLTTLFYSRHLFGKADRALLALAHRRYDLHLLCAPDIPFAQDGTRRDEAFRARQHRWYLDQLAARDLRWAEVSGSVAQRVAQVEAMLRAFA